MEQLQHILQISEVYFFCKHCSTQNTDLTWKLSLYSLLQIKHFKFLPPASATFDHFNQALYALFFWSFLILPIFG